MSFKAMTMWTVVCDEPGCGAVFEDTEWNFVAWPDKADAEEIAEGSEWLCRDGAHFCDEHGPEGLPTPSGREWPVKEGAIAARRITPGSVPA